MADTFTLRLLRYLPRNLISRCFGWFAEIRRPRWFARYCIRTFARKFDVDMTAAVRPLDDYDCLVDFFTRRLKPEARPIADGTDAVVSPVDAKVGAFGRIDDGTLLQAKGMPYRLEALLGASQTARAFDGGTYLTLYLSPRDYHRMHIPCEGRIVETLYEPGTLWPVNPPAVRTVPNLFAVNERVSTILDTARGPVACVMVGATNVGRIRVAYTDLVTNRKGRRHHERHDPALDVRRGDDLGTFELGSTLVLVVADPTFQLEGVVKGDWMPMGQAIGRFISS